jgi:hypothetical protein
MGSFPPSRGTFVTVIGVVVRSIMDTESLHVLAVNTLCPASSTVVTNTGDKGWISPTGTFSTSKTAFGTSIFENNSSDTS